MGSNPPINRWLPWIAAAAAFAVTLPVLTGGFVWDDLWLIQQSPLRSHPGSLGRILLGGHGWGSMVDPDQGAAYFRPLQALLQGTILIVLGARPLPFHLLSALLHAGAALLLGLFLRGRHPRAAWGAVLFAVHPVAADTSGWISAASDGLVALCMLGVLLCLHRPRPRVGWGAVLWFLALCSKESAALAVIWIPVILLALPGEGLARGRGHGAAPAELRRGQEATAHRIGHAGLAFALAAGAYLVLRAAGPGFVRPAGEYPPGVEATGWILTGRLFLLDFWRALMPMRLTLEPPPWVVRAGAPWSGIAGIVLALALLGGSVWRLLRRDPLGTPLALAFVLFLLPLLPVLQIVPTNDIFGGRFLYLPLAGLCLGLGLAYSGWREEHEKRSGNRTLRRHPGARRGERALSVVALLLLMALAVRSAARAAEWRSDGRLFGNEYRRQPGAARAAVYWGGFLLAHGRVDEARPVVEDLARRYPDHPTVRSLQALLWMNEGRLAEAEQAFRLLIRSGKRTPTLLANLATCQMRLGRPEEGLSTLDEATRLTPPTPGMRNNRGLALEMLGRTEEARAEFEQAVREDPAYAPARVNLIRLLAVLRPDPAAAERQAEEFFRRFPDSPHRRAVEALLDSLRVRRGK